MPPLPTWPRHPLLNVWVDDLAMPALFEQLARSGGVVFTINPDHLCHLQTSRAFLAAYRQADFITVDSHYVRLAMGFLGRPVRHRVTGSDMMPAYLAHHRHDPAVRVFLLGARPGVAQRAAERINREAGRELVVGAVGPSMNFVNDPAEIDAVVAQINASGATALFVGLGAPKQELFIASVRHRLPGVRVLAGIGATIDYEAGEVQRAPVWMRRVGLEWFHRVLSDPRRYLMRYVRSSRFIGWVMLERLGRYRDPLAEPATTPAP